MKMKTILVTGGTGYIGSHVCVQLLEAGYQVVIADNLINSKRDVVDRIARITGKTPAFYQTDLLDLDGMRAIFRAHHIDGVIHFAGLKAVGESVAQPLRYYSNNLTVHIHKRASRTARVDGAVGLDKLCGIIGGCSDTPCNRGNNALGYA